MKGISAFRLGMSNAVNLQDGIGFLRRYASLGSQYVDFFRPGLLAKQTQEKDYPVYTQRLVTLLHVEQLEQTVGGSRFPDPRHDGRRMTGGSAWLVIKRTAAPVKAGRTEIAGRIRRIAPGGV
jgi:hypothetical protein